MRVDNPDVFDRQMSMQRVVGGLLVWLDLHPNMMHLNVPLFDTLVDRIITNSQVSEEDAIPSYYPDVEYRTLQLIQTFRLKLFEWAQSSGSYSRIVDDEGWRVWTSDPSDDQISAQFKQFIRNIPSRAEASTIDRNRVMGALFVVFHNTSNGFDWFDDSATIRSKLDWENMRADLNTVMLEMVNIRLFDYNNWLLTSYPFLQYDPTVFLKDSTTSLLALSTTTPVPAAALEQEQEPIPFIPQPSSEAQTLGELMPSFFPMTIRSHFVVRILSDGMPDLTIHGRSYTDYSVLHLQRRIKLNKSETKELKRWEKFATRVNELKGLAKEEYIQRKITSLMLQHDKKRKDLEQRQIMKRLKKEERKRERKEGKKKRQEEEEEEEEEEEKEEKEEEEEEQKRGSRDKGRKEAREERREEERRGEERRKSVQSRNQARSQARSQVKNQQELSWRTFR